MPDDSLIKPRALHHLDFFVPKYLHPQLRKIPIHMLSRLPKLPFYLPSNAVSLVLTSIIPRLAIHSGTSSKAVVQPLEDLLGLFIRTQKQLDQPSLGYACELLRDAMVKEKGLMTQRTCGTLMTLFGQMDMLVEVESVWDLVKGNIERFKDEEVNQIFSAVSRQRSAC